MRVALDTPYVGGVCIQPQFSSGRSGSLDPSDRLTHTGVLARSVGYLLRDDSGDWRSPVGLVGPDRLARTQRAEQPGASRGRRPPARHLRRLRPGAEDAAHAGLGGCPGRRRRLCELLGARVERITVKPFMDIHRMLEERLTQCCVHLGTRSPDQDQRAPFCAVQAWPPLAAQKLAARRDPPVAT